VNTEELELSLRSEFEAHLKQVFADVQQQVVDFQDKIETELGKHREQMLEVLNSFASQAAAEPAIDKAFSESILEHLRIARDEGAKLAAKAMADAETMDSASPSSVSFNFARDAVKDISGQTSQADILQALVRHCEHFAPRGVFFIVRNEHFIGWQALGDESHADDDMVRSLSFPVSSDTVLGDCVRSLSTVERSAEQGADESTYLNALGFRSPSSMKAIPLVARGRGVAALYVDSGSADRPVNIEALEMLVRVAGLTVELLASNQAARPQTTSVAAPAPAPEPVQEYEAAAADENAAAVEYETAQPDEPAESVPAYEVETFEPAPEAAEPETVHAEIVENYSEPAEAAPVQNVAADEGSAATNGFEFKADYEPEVQHFEDADFVEHAQSDSDGSETVEAAPSPEPPKPVSGTRRLDLPIEVSEDERGTHTKARRFARLLVSEIKLYNEDKVKQGREAGDLYGRLKEAIDRSREMYDKRVEPPVSSKFDYFHYELVNDLAEGDPNRLGSSYPGATV
jgi:hypothetical protein